MWEKKGRLETSYSMFTKSKNVNVLQLSLCVLRLSKCVSVKLSSCCCARGVFVCRGLSCA